MNFEKITLSKELKNITKLKIQRGIKSKRFINSMDKFEKKTKKNFRIRSACDFKTKVTSIRLNSPSSNTSSIGKYVMGRCNSANNFNDTNSISATNDWIKLKLGEYTEYSNTK